jgi:lysophospholipase L1-like esterase
MKYEWGILLLGLFLVGCTAALSESEGMATVAHNPTSIYPTTMPAPTETAAPTPTATMAETSAHCEPASYEPVRILALGDSYTIGTGVEPAERWPVQLVELMRGEGWQAAEPEIVARNGWTTAELMRGIQQADLPERPFDLVTLLIGVNNQYRGLSLDEYGQQFVNLLEQAIAFAGERPGQVLVLSIPDYSVTPFGRGRESIAAEINRFNTVNRAEAARVGALYLDITPLSRQAADDLTLLADDELHPSGKMYGQWAQMALPLVCQALAKTS